MSTVSEQQRSGQSASNKVSRANKGHSTTLLERMNRSSGHAVCPEVEQPLTNERPIEGPIESGKDSNVVTGERRSLEELEANTGDNAIEQEDNRLKWPHVMSCCRN